MKQNYHLHIKSQKWTIWKDEGVASLMEMLVPHWLCPSVSRAPCYCVKFCVASLSLRYCLPSPLPPSTPNDTTWMACIVGPGAPTRIMRRTLDLIQCVGTYTPHRSDQQYIDGLAQDCGISIADAMEIPQSFAKPSMSIWSETPWWHVGELLYSSLKYRVSSISTEMKIPNAVWWSNGKWMRLCNTYVGSVMITEYVAVIRGQKPTGFFNNDGVAWS